MVAVGLGSFAFHTWRGEARCCSTVASIGLFIYGYFLLALRRFLLLSWPVSLALLAGFVVLSLALASYVPREVLNGSSGYFPALAALIVLGWLSAAARGGAGNVGCSGPYSVFR